jgi:hypothetical protein
MYKEKLNDCKELEGALKNQLEVSEQEHRVEIEQIHSKLKQSEEARRASEEELDKIK